MDSEHQQSTIRSNLEIQKRVCGTALISQALYANLVCGGRELQIPRRIENRFATAKCLVSSHLHLFAEAGA